MKLLVVAVGQRQPGWAETAWADFAKRFPPEMRLELKALKAEPRSGGKSAAQCMAAEAQRIEAACPRGARRVVLDEHGTRLTTAQLAARLHAWRGEGRDVALLVGASPRKAGMERSAEALYRAWSLSEGHPYHRE